MAKMTKEKVKDGFLESKIDPFMYLNQYTCYKVIELKQYLCNFFYLTNVAVGFADGVLANAGRRAGVFDVSAILSRRSAASKNDLKLKRNTMMFVISDCSNV